METYFLSYAPLSRFICPFNLSISLFFSFLYFHFIPKSECTYFSTLYFSLPAFHSNLLFLFSKRSYLKSNFEATTGRSF